MENWTLLMEKWIFIGTFFLKTLENHGKHNSM
jgi:hypothetical protein